MLSSSGLSLSLLPSFPNVSGRWGGRFEVSEYLQADDPLTHVWKSGANAGTQTKIIPRLDSRIDERAVGAQCLGDKTSVI